METENLALSESEELNKRLQNCIKALEQSFAENGDAENRLLIDNLWNHQIELEMRNRQLIESQSDLENTRDKYANLYDFAPIGFVSFDRKGCIQEINLTACQMLGYEREVILGKPFSTCLSLNDAQKFFRHLKDAFSSLNKNKIHLSVKSKKGSFLDVELESTYQLTNSKVEMIQTALIDVSDRVLAEQGQAENEHQLHSIINALPIMVAYINAEQQYIFTNDAHDKNFPVNDGIYVGKKIIDIMGEEFYSLVMPYIDSTLEGQEVIIEINPMMHGVKKVYHLNLLPNLSKSGLTKNFYMMLTDITVFSEKELMSMTHLSSSAHEARINLIGQMTAEIAHEINQPLAAIANYSVAGLRMQHSGNLSSQELTEIFQEIDNQVHRATIIISHLRKFSKKRDLQLAITDINSLVKEALKLMAVDEHWYGLQINTELDENVVSLPLDTILIEQVFVNLLRNATEAIVASNQKYPQISIKTKMKENDILISISDNGPGMSYKMLGDIFTPFYSTKESGVGLGLSICKWIIESHEGKIWATRNSQNGSSSGTTFYIQLPIIDNQQ